MRPEYGMVFGGFGVSKHPTAGYGSGWWCSTGMWDVGHKSAPMVLRSALPGVAGVVIV